MPIPYLKLGATLKNGCYKIEKKLGSGGVGNTYLVFNNNLKNYRVVKEYGNSSLCKRKKNSNIVTNKDENLMKREVSRFEQEARDLAKIKHQGVVTVFEVWLENETAYYSMEYVEGGELLTSMDREWEPMAWEKASEIAIALLESLKAVHDANLLHGDIKSRNILIRKTGMPILIDFGSARPLESMKKKIEKNISYTRGYTPLELQIRERIQEACPASDLYSWAMVVIGLLAKHPSSLENNGSHVPIDVEIREKNEEDKYSEKSLEKWLPSIPKVIISILASCLILDPKQRPQSAKIVIEQLKNAKLVPRTESILEAEPTISKSRRTLSRSESTLSRSEPAISGSKDLKFKLVDLEPESPVSKFKLVNLEPEPAVSGSEPVSELDPTVLELDPPVSELKSILEKPFIPKKNNKKQTKLIFGIIGLGLIFIFIFKKSIEQAFQPPVQEIEQETSVILEGKQEAERATSVIPEAPSRQEVDQAFQAAMQEVKLSTLIPNETLFSLQVNVEEAVATINDVLLPDLPITNVFMPQRPFTILISADNYEEETITFEQAGRIDHNVTLELLSRERRYQIDCDNGSMRRCVDLGNISRREDRDEEAASLFRTACNNRNMDGCNNLGFMYSSGRGVNRDFEEAARFHRLACNGGNVAGCYNLGVMSLNGRGVSRDYREAVRRFRSACIDEYENSCELKDRLCERYSNIQECSD